MTTTPKRADATATASDEGWRSRLVSAGAAASAVPPGSTVDALNVGYESEMAFVAVTGPRENEQVVASAQYYFDADTGSADVAYMVDSSWHGLGLGHALHGIMSDYAARHGVLAFTADVLAGNGAMLHVLTAAGDAEVHTAAGVHELRIPTRTAAGDSPWHAS